MTGASARRRRQESERQGKPRPGAREAPAGHSPQADSGARAAGPRRGTEPPAKTPRRSTPHSGRSVPDFPWALIGALSILPLLWASRSPTLGMPVADDYLFLSRLFFDRPLEFFGPMGAAYYWRPVSRQAYYLLVGPWLVRAPWVATLVAALLLLALYAVLYRLARRLLPGDGPASRALAASIACFPLLGEPARVLLAWPSASQHLLGALFAAWALERAAAGRLAAAGAAALLAILSNEAAFVTLPALPLLAWSRTRERGTLLRWGAATVLVATVWVAGYAIARRHGAGLPAGAGAGVPWDSLVAVIVQAFVSQLGYEGLAPALRGPLLALAGLMGLAALALSLFRPARPRVARAWPVLLGALAWFLVAAAPLVYVLPDWNAWRGTVASLGLAFALTGWLGLAAPPLAGALVALRLAVLLLASPAPAIVPNRPPPTTSSFSLARLVRLQRITESARRTLGAEAPVLPRGGIVRYWQLPLLSEVGFNGDHALRVWYRDSTLAWRSFGGELGRRERTDALLEFEHDLPWPAVRIAPEALRLFDAAREAGGGTGARRSDSLLREAQRVQPMEARAFQGTMTHSRAALAWNMQEYARAESLNEASYRLQGDSPGYWSLEARIAARRGDARAAADAARRCLELDPRDADGLSIARALGLAPAPR